VASGVKSPEQSVEEQQTVTLTKATELFQKAKGNEGVAADVLNKYEREIGRFRDFMMTRGVIFPWDITSEDLIEYQDTWKTQYPSSRTRSRVLTRVRSFGRFCYEHGWLELPLKFSKVRVIKSNTLPLDKQEYEALLLAAIEVYAFDVKKSQRVRGLIQFMRWSGLAIIDAVGIERSQLTWNSEKKLYQVRAKRQKTQTAVYVPFPQDVAEEVLAVPNDNPKYLFWNTGTGKLRSAVTNWQHDLRPVFRKAGMVDGHPHQLRDTFAVELLAVGVPLEEVSKLLGHDSIKTTETHYAPWVKSRQDRLDALVSATWVEPSAQ
jgi:site-specific recombinase XerD